MEEDYYHVRVTVDGVKIPADQHCAGNSNACRFRVRIRSIKPMIAEREYLYNHTNAQASIKNKK